MIVTFNYSEKGVKDPRPILLFLHRNLKTDNLEGLNMNYLNPTKLKKLFDVAYFRIQISNPKKRSAMSTKRFYGDVILADKYFKQAYRSYKLTNLTSLKVTQINIEFIKSKNEN